MISISNIGPFTGEPSGIYNYEVAINREVLATFTHCQTDGLVACLVAAANAVQLRKLESVKAGDSPLLEKLSGLIVGIEKLKKSCREESLKSPLTPITDAVEHECNRLPLVLGFLKMRNHAQELEIQLQKANGALLVATKGKEEE